MSRRGGDPPGRTPASGGGGGLQGPGGGNRSCAGGSGGRPPPPFNNRVKMFVWAQFNILIPDVTKGGADQWRFIATCWRAMGLGGMEGGGRTS